jgi:hypothetical protein
VNGSQSKFLEGTCSISQDGPDAPLFQLGQDHIATEESLILGTGLDNRKLSESTDQSEQTPIRYSGNQNQISKAIHCLTHISSNTLWACVFEKTQRAIKKL